MLKIAICDDERDILKELSAQIEAEFHRKECNFLLRSFSSADDFLEEQKKHPFDVLFLDIDMPGTDGIELGGTLRRMGDNSCIIYLSNREERVFETFAVEPLRFIRKSHFFEEIEDAACAIIDWSRKRKKETLLINSHGKILAIPMKMIHYVECWAKVQSIITEKETYEVKSTLYELEEELKPFGFLKPHKGYLVNYRQVEVIQENSILLRNGTIIPVSKHRLKEVRQEYLRLVTKSIDIG